MLLSLSSLVEIGDYFFMSSVETIVPPIRINDPQSSFDRTPSAGEGHLFKFTQDGSLLDVLILGEDTMHHTGGIDFDGQFIWASVAEYRPNSQPIVYKIDPETMKPKVVFRSPNHLSSILEDFTSDPLYAVNRESRKFYQWGIDAGQQKNTPDSTDIHPNRHHYIDYQDCQ